MNSKNKSKENMSKENRITKILSIAVIVLAVSIGIFYIVYYSSLEELGKNDIPSTQEYTAYPINPFEAYSSLREDIINKFGEGEMGEGVDDPTKYIEYTQTWFGLEGDIRYYYGKENRVYKSIVSYEEDQADKLYINMVNELGEPLEDGFDDEENDEKQAYWIKDSVSYLLYTEDETAKIESTLPYYRNPNNYDMGDRPTIIQRINTDIDNDDNQEAILLIGSKETYTSKVYKNIYLLIGNSKGAYYTKLPDENDGGADPKLYLEDINDDSQLDMVVESDQFYIKSYTGFEFKENEIRSIYSGSDNPITEK